MQKVKDIVSISSGKVLPVIVQFLWFLVVGKKISLP